MSTERTKFQLAVFAFILGVLGFCNGYWQGKDSADRYYHEHPVERTVIRYDSIHLAEGMDLDCPRCYDATQEITCNNDAGRPARREEKP
jgi:hypothetical protein